VTYIRVSSKDQEREGFSIPAQKRLLRSYAQQHNISILRVFEDIETAKHASTRAKFIEMLGYLKDNPRCNIVLVEKTDRLYRNIRDYVDLDKLKLEIHFVKENFTFSEHSRSAEKLMHRIKVVFAQNFIDNLSEEASKGMREKARQGLWPSFAPLGYQNTPGPKGKKIIAPDPESGPIVVKMFDWYGTGMYSIKQITKMASAAGLRFKRSKYSVPLSTVHKMLRNRIYYGDFIWAGVLYEGKHKPLVSRELWIQVQNVMNGDRKQMHKDGRRTFAYSRLIKCGHCGCSLIGELKKNKYIYYHCSGYKGKCPEPYVREEVLDEKFAEMLERLRLNQDVMDWVCKALRRIDKSDRVFRSKAIKKLQVEYDKLHDRLDLMYRDRLDGRLDPGQYDELAEKCREQMDRIYSDIIMNEADNEERIEEGIVTLELARSASTLFLEQPGEKKRMLLADLLSNCIWQNSELSFEFKQPFAILADTNMRYMELKAAGAESNSLFEIWYP
jgi:DNA invertase Pin-like site-specific DNA recombinase